MGDCTGRRESTLAEEHHLPSRQIGDVVIEREQMTDLGDF